MKYLLSLVFCFLFLNVLVADFEISTIDHKTHKGKIVEFSQNNVKLEGPNSQIIFITNNDIIKIENLGANEELQTNSNNACIKLTNSSMVYGQIKDGSSQAIGMDTSILGFFSVDLTKIRQILFIDNVKIENNTSENDILYFKSGDMMKGLIEEFGSGYVQIDHEQLGSRRESFADLKAISFALLESLEHNKSSDLTTIIGVDNSKLIGKIANITENTLTLQLEENDSPIEIALTKVKHILFNNERFMYLSDMDFKVKYIPYFFGNKNPNPVQMNKNYAGQTIMLKGQVFFKGIGTISKTQVNFDLEQKYSKFRCYLGIDDQISELYKKNSNILGGSVVFRVYLDNRKLYESGIVYHFSDLIQVDLDISKGNTLMLEVDFGDNAHVNDFANWADAILVR